MDKVAPSPLVRWADYLIAKTPSADIVRSGTDWDIISEIVDFYFKFFPIESSTFKATVSDIRSSRKNKKGLSDSHEIQYTAALPPRLMMMIKAIFPYQQFDKKFIYRLIWKVPVLKIGRYA